MTHHYGLIAAGDPQTAQAGATILRQGGNAIDAAVAAAFASFVAEAVLVNINGGGVATVHLAQPGKTIALDFFADMPSGKFTPGDSDFKEIVIDFGDEQQSFFIGRASAAVPGAVAGLCRLATEYGSLPPKKLLEPAISLAENGVTLSKALGYVAYLLRDIFTDTPSVAKLFAPTGKIVAAGDTLVNPALAQTLRTVAAHGAHEFYHGTLAQKIVADQQAHGGLISAADMAAYRVRESRPISVPYRGYTILLPPPASVGSVLIAFTLKLLSHFDLTGMAVESVSRYRLLAEAFRVTNIARRDLKPDDDGISEFLSDAHVQPYVSQLQDLLAGASAPSEPAFPPTSRDTTHISVMDAAGNVVSITTSAGESAGYFVADTGMLMNNILGEIDLHPDGFHSAPPGSRLQTMMSPAIVLHDGSPVLAVGSGGSTRIRSALVQVLSNVLDFGVSLADAVDFPRLHFEENVLQLEGGTSPQIIDAMQNLGYSVNVWQGKNMYFGGVHSVGLPGGNWQAVGDTRRGGVALVV